MTNMIKYEVQPCCVGEQESRKILTDPVNKGFNFSHDFHLPAAFKTSAHTRIPLTRWELAREDPDAGTNCKDFCWTSTTIPRNRER